MTVRFDDQTITASGGGTGGQPCENVPGAPPALVGILYDCHAYTDDGRRIPRVDNR